MPRKVLVGQLKQETNGFNASTTPLATFVKQGLFEGDALLAYFNGVNLEVGGFLEVGAEEGWEIVPSVATFAPPGGEVEDDAFDHLCGKIIAACDRAAPLDGVLLALHGSMMVTSHPDAEGEIVRRVRNAVGPDVPIVVSLDPHCNISHEMAALVQGMIAFRTSPHVDQRKTGIRAARMLAKIFARGAMPTCVLARRRMLMGFDGARTYHDYGPFREALALAEGFETEEGILAVSIHAGYSKADGPITGPSVAVTGFAARERLEQIASAMMDECWRTRGETSERIVSLDEARAAILAKKPGDKPVILGDYGDSLGGGAYGDGTALLSLLLDCGVQNAFFAPMFDPEAVTAAVAAGQGATIRLALGGKCDPDHGGGPVEADWQVALISDGNFVYTGPYGTGTRGTFGQSVLLRHKGVTVMTISTHKGIYDQEQLRIFGIEPATQDYLVLKSMQAYRGDFQHLASVCLDVDSGGISSPDPARFDWHNLPRPIWPIDADITG